MTKEEFEQTERIIKDSILIGTMISTARVIDILESALDLEKDTKEKLSIQNLIQLINSEQCMGIEPNRAKSYSDLYRMRYLDKIQ